MTSGGCEAMLAPPSFCWPNLGCESPLAETRARLAGEKVALSRFRCGQAITVNRGKRDIHGSRDIHGLQLVPINSQLEDI